MSGCVCVCACVCVKEPGVRVCERMRVCGCRCVHVCVWCVCVRQNFGSSPLYAGLCVSVSVSVSVSVCIRTSASHRGGGRPAVCKAVGHRDFIREAE
jgi:hypothetical protein